MPNIQLFNVAPNLPEELKFLETLSYNMWWCWHHDAIELFRRISPALWKELGGNARRFLSLIPQEQLRSLARDKGFLAHLRRVEEAYRDEIEVAGAEIFRRKGTSSAKAICYFSLEYGLHESVRLYSGGLGILAGDHLKSASDMQLPLVAVGLLYGQGYFRQVLDQSGWQLEKYPENEIHHMPVTRARDQDGQPITVSLQLLDREVKAIVWTLKVGSVPLLLLDTEIPENPPDIRQITWRLYGGDKRMRLHQELLLGIGGLKAIIKAGYEPAVCHLNEGHAAFLSLARIGHLVRDKGLDINTAIEFTFRTNVFTTHTPVAAGNEAFDIGLLRPYLEALQGDFGIDVDRVLSWGRPAGSDGHELSMTILGLRMSHYSNGVSRLHGEVAREMWKNLWPGRPSDEIPIDHITNGVHVASWISSPCRELYARYLGPDWENITDEKYLTSRIDLIPDEELWRVHELCRASLIRYVRTRFSDQLHQRNATAREVQMATTILQPDILTIGFSRRFATYKRATLLLRDKERLTSLLSNRDCPVQVLFAGKAHPADEAGKNLIREIVQFSEQANVRNRILFLEDYDMSMARHLVQGVDIWLNNPLRPQEASGTSGMKAAINGVLNCSILDGWWVEGYEAYPSAGWAIASADDNADPGYRDSVEAQALYNLLETEIIPTYYSRTTDGLPRRWVRMMKDAIKMSIWQFASRRMTEDYARKFYQPALGRYDELIANKARKTQELVVEKQRYADLQGGVHIQFPRIDGDISHFHVGDTMRVSTEVVLGELRPEEVRIEVYYGPVNIHNNITRSFKQVMQKVEDLGPGRYLYTTEIVCHDNGRFGMSARALPASENWHSAIPGFIRWAE